MIESDRLNLRAIVPTDCKAFSELFADPAVMKYSNYGTKTSEEIRIWIEDEIKISESGNGINLFAIVKKGTSTLVGYCGLTHYPDIDGIGEVEIGYRLIKKYWGCGFATEAASAVRDYAFNHLKLLRLVALIEPTNKRSIAVARKIGMLYEKDVMLADYDYPDHLYSMSKYAIKE